MVQVRQRYTVTLHLLFTITTRSPASSLVVVVDLVLKSIISLDLLTGPRMLCLHKLLADVEFISCGGGFSFKSMFQTGET